MYPHERSLVKRLEGRPFALVGINSDKNLDELHAAMAQEQITWPSWFDGGSTGGPIASLYQVRAWPTIYVLDPKGVIRFKDVRGEALDKAVDTLLDEPGLATTDPPARRPQATRKTPRRPQAKGAAKHNPGNMGDPGDPK